MVVYVYSPYNQEESSIEGRLDRDEIGPIFIHRPVSRHWWSRVRVGRRIAVGSGLLYKSCGEKAHGRHRIKKSVFFLSARDPAPPSMTMYLCRHLCPPTAPQCLDQKEPFLRHSYVCKSYVHLECCCNPWLGGSYGPPPMDRMVHRMVHRMVQTDTRTATSHNMCVSHRPCSDNSL